MLGGMEKAGVPADTVTYSTLITTWAADGKAALASDAHSRMPPIGFEADPYTFSEIFAAVLRDRTGTFDRQALELFDSVPLVTGCPCLHADDVDDDDTVDMHSDTMIAPSRVMALLREARANIDCTLRPHHVFVNNARRL